MPIIENKKIILFLGCVTLFFPGSFVFGFPGVMADQWQMMFGVNKAQTGRLMFFVVAGTGFSMFLSGKLQEFFSFRRMILIGCLACGSAMFFVGKAVNMGQVYIWAFTEGFFTGFVYIPCLTFFQKLFPEKKGLATGILNLTFGGAAAVMSPLYTWLLVTKGYGYTSNTAAVVAIVLGSLASLFIKIPGEDHVKGQVLVSTLSVSSVLKQKSFWFLWLVWAFSGAAGVSLIVLSAVYGRYLGYDVTQFVYILICFNILNGIGRLVCGRLSDILPKQKILMAIFLMAAGAYIGLSFSKTLVPACFFACFIGLAFGGLFTVSAPLVTDVFGLENFGKIFGLVFTAYGFFAGILGPWLSGIILDMTQSNFKIVFSMFALFYVISSFLILNVRQVQQ